MEKIYRAFMVMVVVLMAREVSAAQHAVGGSQGWVESADFDSWASKETFKVGDQLVFKYSSGLHSVVELPSESAYKKCDLGTTKTSMSTGNDAVKLDKPGTRYFACGTPGHCDQGMKVKITTAGAASGPTSSSSSSGSSSSSSSSTTDSTSGAPVFGPLASLLLLVVALLAKGFLV